MIESVLSAWSLASLLSRFYLFLSGALGWLVVGVAWEVAPRPTGVLSRALEGLDLQSPAILEQTSSWITDRGQTLTHAAIVAAVVAVSWSCAFLARNPYDFDRVRGPATLWVSSALVAEAQGVPFRWLNVMFVAVGIVVVVVVADRLHSKRSAAYLYDRDAWIATRTLFALVAGVVVVLFTIPLLLIHGLGGMSPRKPHQEGVTAER